LSTDGIDLDAVSDRELWLNTGQGARAPRQQTRSNVDVVGRVDDATLDRLYRAASCVVAPAFDEDYGLTAIEAMTYGRPVVVCDDGGGLADLVDDGVTGLVVAPTGRAIAEAVQALVADPERRRAMGEAGLAQAASFTWERAAAELQSAIGEVLA
jgi:glycosyltransferase involved in cell wall biosynthesis